MTLRYVPIDTDTVRALQAGGPDAHGLPAERAVSDGGGNPCRHCLRHIPEGADMLILAHRPFPQAQPYAETGPIFLCAAACDPWDGGAVPPILSDAGEERLVKGYSPDNRIVYGLGKVVPVEGIAARAETVLEDRRVAYVHVRSATNNCFTCRIERG